MTNPVNKLFMRILFKLCNFPFFKIWRRAMTGRKKGAVYSLVTGEPAETYATLYRLN